VIARLIVFVRWYLREFTGQADYDRYLVGHAHSGVPAMPRREFERCRVDRAAQARGTRCC
jgi:uncharacterized short protein YbdD (DUF466 family)